MSGMRPSDNSVPGQGVESEADSGLRFRRELVRHSPVTAWCCTARLACLVAAVLVAASGCSRPAERDPEVLARVGAREIRVPEFRDHLRRRSLGKESKQLEAALEERIEAEALVQRAIDLGLDKDPDVRRSWENILIARLRATQLEPRLTNAMPSKEQVRQYYATNQTQFTEAAQRRGAVLFLEVPLKSSEERRQKVRRRMEEARSKALELVQEKPDTRGFGALAIEYSEDQPTRYRGGDVGWLTAGRVDGRYDPIVTETLFALNGTGAVSEVLTTARGFYVVRLLEEKGQRVKPIEGVEALIQQKLLFNGRQQLEADWKRDARGAVKVETFPEALAKLRESLPAIETKPDSPPALR